MQLDKKRIKRIMKKYKDSFAALEEYDKTLELPSQKKRIDITLSVSTINKLKELREKIHKPVSHIIEEKLAQ